MSDAVVTNYDDYIHEPNNRELEHIPGDYGKLPFLGHTLTFVQRPLEFTRENADQYGLLFRSSFGGSRGVFALGPDLVQQVFLDPGRDFSSKMGFADRLATFFEGSLIMEDFEHHRHERRIFQTAFKNDSLKYYTDEINGVYRDAMTRWRADSGNEILFFDYIKNLLLQVAAEIFIGVEGEGEHISRLNKAFVDCANGNTYIFPLYIPGSTYYKGINGKRYLKKYFASLVDEKRNNSGRDMMSLFCKERDENGQLFSDEEVTNQTIFLLFAAHDTTTSAITHTIYFLARNPEIRQRLYEECVAVGKDELGYDDLDKVPYMQQVFNEVQRIRPSVPMIPRRTIRDVEMAGYNVPAHTTVWLTPRFTHWMPEYWSEPERFDPDRFSPERAEHKQHPFLFHPFGGGAHKCIGMHFSQMEYKCFLHQFILQFEFESRHKDQDVFMQTFPLPKPGDDMPILLKSR
jgi:cytochrome P450